MTDHVRHDARRCSAAAAVSAVSAALLISTAATAAPPIRITDANRVPSCVSPDRLMEFLKQRNGSLDPRFRDIARWYRHYGEQWNVRWDYAFYQMILETNGLKYKRGNGRRGDVHEKQNNFAGIGATGGGVAGERFADIKTGVHAQIQHLVAYSGEWVKNPVAKRTSENQDSIVERSRRLKRPVTFGDLARRWAADRQYAKSIDAVATKFREGYCHGPAPKETETADAGGIINAKYDGPTRLGGPKPQRLAGPETLPWDGESENAAGAPRAGATTEAPPPARAGTKKSGPPVRTLWSREKGLEQAPSAKNQPAATDPAEPEAAANAADAPAIPQETVAAQPALREPAVTENAESDAIELPVFRIAPRTPEPSKLGGPVAAADSAPVDAAKLKTTSAAEPALPPGPPGTLVEPPSNLETANMQTAFATQSVPEPRPARPLRPAAIAENGTPSTAGKCRVLTASYGGKKTLLVSSGKDGVQHLTALTVLDGFEQSMFDTFVKNSAPGAEIIGTFANKNEALAEAKALCPAG